VVRESGFEPLKISPLAPNRENRNFSNPLILIHYPAIFCFLTFLLKSHFYFILFINPFSSLFCPLDHLPFIMDICTLPKLRSTFFGLWIYVSGPFLAKGSFLEQGCSSSIPAGNFFNHFPLDKPKLYPHNPCYFPPVQKILSRLHLAVSVEYGYEGSGLNYLRNPVLGFPGSVYF